MRAKRLLAVPVAILATATGLSSQVPTPSPRFEVVSVKPHSTDDGSSGSGLRPGGLYSVVNGTVFGEIATAFGGEQPLQSSQVIGAPDWVSTARFDITAKAADPNVSLRDVLPMLQMLLADRFHVQVHHEKREQPVFALVTLRGDGHLGPRLRPSSLDCDAVARARRDRAPLPPNAPPDRPACGFRMNGGPDGLIMAAGGITMDRLASLLGHYADERIVIDRTGLAGVFDVDLHWDLSRANATNDVPTVFAAVQEQLGLKLESARELVDVLVIDHIEKPTDD